MAPPSLLRLFVIGDSISIHCGPPRERLREGAFRHDRKRGDDEAPPARFDLNVPTGADGGHFETVRARQAAFIREHLPRLS